MGGCVNANRFFVRRIRATGDLRSGAKKVDYFDATQRGFLLEVPQSGGKTYYQRYTDERGRERQYKIGPAEILTLDQARRKGRQVVAEALLGADPQQKRREMRAVPRLGPVRARSHPPYVRTYKNSWRTDETVLRIHILPKLGALALDEIKTDAIANLINCMRADGYASGTINRVIVILRYIYNLARKWKTSGSVENPAAGLSAGPDVQRNRLLRQKPGRSACAIDPRDETKLLRGQSCCCCLPAAVVTKSLSPSGIMNWKNKTLLVPKSKSGRARVIALDRIGHRSFDGSTARGQSIYFSVPGQWSAVGLVAFPLGSYP